MVVLSIILGTVFACGVLWCVGVLVFNDFSLTPRNVWPYKRILVIFPHPDDEAVHAGGLLARASATPGCTTKLVILTKGERGTPDAHLDPQLAARREQEAKVAARAYRVPEFVQEDFGDGELAAHRPKLAAYVTSIFEEFQPDLVVTYDLGGEYGHPDHVVLSEIVTELVKTKYQGTALWYATLSAPMLKFSAFPIYMADDPNFAQKCSKATIRVPNGWRVLQKLRAVYAHKSQLSAIRDEMPFKLPLWLLFSVAIYDYFCVANEPAVHGPTLQAAQQDKLQKPAL